MRRATLRHQGLSGDGDIVDGFLAAGEQVIGDERSERGAAAEHAVLPGVFDRGVLRSTLEHPSPTDAQADQREHGEDDRRADRAA